MSERQEFQNEQNWSTRGYLPHYDVSSKYQMITYRLSDSLPQGKLKELSKQENFEKRKAIELQLDRGYGSCILRKEAAAQIIVDSWKFFNEKRYDLIAYVVMPNHVHNLIRTYADFSLGKLVQSWKRHTAKSIKSLYSQDDCRSIDHDILLSGRPFWQREYWDRFIRDEKHFSNAVDYIHQNPVKAGLCQTQKSWPWSSIHGV